MCLPGFSHAAGIIPMAFYTTVFGSGGLRAAYTTAICTVFLLVRLWIPCGWLERHLNKSTLFS